MNTRSSILIQIPNSFLNSTAKYNAEMFKNRELIGMDRWGEENCEDKAQEILITKSYLGIYCHFDGYPNGVGKELVSSYNDFSSAFNLILGGDCSFILAGEIKRYATRKGENWKYIQPRQLDEVKTVSSDSQYLYLFENNHWNLITSGYKIYLYPDIDNLEDYVRGYLNGVEDSPLFSSSNII